jgi:hypothetical protein
MWGRSAARARRLLRGKQVIGQCFNCFAGFQQADADGVEVKLVG